MAEVAKNIQNQLFYKGFCYIGHAMLRPKINKDSAKSHPKTLLKSIPQLASILEPTWLHFGRVWGRFWVKKSTQQPNNQNSKNLKKHCVLQCFLLLRPCHVEVKINKNAANNPSKTTLKSTSQLASILQPTWLHFGRVLGAKLEPSWHQIAPKVDPKSDPKKRSPSRWPLDGFLIDFGFQLGSQEGGPEITFRSF